MALHPRRYSLGSFTCIVTATALVGCGSALAPAAPLLEPQQSAITSPSVAAIAHGPNGVTADLPALAFASDRAGSGDIFVQGPDRPPVDLTDYPGGDWDPTWSPACADPQLTCQIAFTSQRSGDSEIWTMDDRGRNLHNVTQHPAWDYWPAWSPDGRELAFVSERDGNPELYVQPPESRQATRLTFNTESDRQPAWSPVGSRIAFAAVRRGIEEIHVIEVPESSAPQPEAARERALTRWPLNGTSPAWSPDGDLIAFVGWDERNRPGIYTVDVAGGEPHLLWKSSAWIGSLTWAADPSGPGQAGWLLFTSWQDGNHELYALPATGGSPVRLTRDPAWDDFPALRPGGSFSTAAYGLTTEEGVVTSSPASDGGFAYGVNLADLGNAYLARDLGFGWAKGYVNWETVEPKRGEYRWDDPDNTVNAFRSQGLHILLRVHGTPSWARPASTFLSYPPDDMTDFARFVRALAGRFQGQVDAYEIWNEPNLNYEWGYLRPDPARYTELLRAAYGAVKEADPQTRVISAGLATTGDGSDTAMGDLAFLRGMYAAGARGTFDALGSHPYTFGHDPDYQDAWGLSLSRVVQQHEVMTANGDTSTPVWITELGWVLHSSWNLVEHARSGVSLAEQGRYLARAYQKTRAEWPWVGALFLFNLDFGSVPWYAAAEPMRWYAILNPDRTPRAAYTNIKYQMANLATVPPQSIVVRYTNAASIAE
jgi:hypothetical protein